ncbi:MULTISPECIES: DNA primase [unclassified Mycoplasma]|uniref:DNA primase n=1 Tax=unclassified Mycoplasma TaxID=2683645 RepID=UPI00211C2E37|nr:MULTISPECIES: DNA primase [unclassified Mycoplasma]UUM19533.1 DNA primase [Mycoplasma sp. 1578d]UUM24453.1 DNA primase [Mycoplasma sp. 3686d]
MKNISTNTIDLIVRSSNIVNVISQFISLNKKGNNYVGICPFHADTSPSLTVSPAKNIYKCFACGHSGNVVHFVKEFKKISYVQALEFLAQQANLPINFDQFKNVNKITRDPAKQKMYDLLDTVNSYFKLNINNELAQKFLNYRKINQIDILEKFDIGFAPLNNYTDILKTNQLYSDLDLNQAGLINDNLNLIFKNRIIFGIRNERGEIVGFSGRSIGDDKKYAKYLNSPESQIFKKSRILYNFNNAQDSAFDKREIIIVEGFMDVIALYQAGINNVIALMGTALTNAHLSLLKDLKVILFLDNDTAGQSATNKSLVKLIENKFEVEVVINNFNKDPDEILNNHGADVLVDILKNSRKNGAHIVYDNFKILYRLNRANVDITSVNFGLLKENLINIFANATAKTQLLIQERMMNDFNVQLSLRNDVPFTQAKKVLKNTNIVQHNKTNFSLEKSVIYGNVKMEVLLACLANYHLRDLINRDIANQNQGNLNAVLNQFSIFANEMYYQDDQEVNLEPTFREILALNLNYQIQDQSQNEAIKEQFINKLKEQIVSFYQKLNPNEVTKEIKQYLINHAEQINSINEQNFAKNLYLKSLTNKLEFKRSNEYQHLLKKSRNEHGDVPTFALESWSKRNQRKK